MEPYGTGSHLCVSAPLADAFGTVGSSHRQRLRPVARFARMGHPDP